MAATNYLQNKYVGKYRVMADIDMSTNDFCRDHSGQLNNPYDVYIKCNNNIKIYHYGGDQLIVYIPSLGRGRNILKAVADRIGISFSDYTKEVKNKKGNISTKYEYDKFYQALNDNGYIYNIEETDKEILFKIRNKNLANIINLLKPQTSGKNMSPFKVDNLKIGTGKNAYNYTEEQELNYQKAKSEIKKKDNLVIGKINEKFINNVLTRRMKKSAKEIKAERKLMKLKNRDYIYEMGYEKDYLEYLEKEIKKHYEKGQVQN